MTAFDGVLSVYGRSASLHLVMVHAKALTDMRANLEDAIRQAWQQRIPAKAIAEAAGYTDEASVRMLAKRRGWER